MRGYLFLSNAFKCGPPDDSLKTIHHHICVFFFKANEQQASARVREEKVNLNKDMV